MERTWNYEQAKLFRAEKLYTAKNYAAFLEAFQKNLSKYTYFCPFRERAVISAPLSSIEKVYVPSECLRSLIQLDNKDSLQEMTLDFLYMLSRESRIILEDFGVHGSVALNMHSAKSDIDVVVYGAENFRKLEKTVDRLVKAGSLTYQANNRLDAARHFKGRYRNKIFMYNAIRKPEEINSKYGSYKYSPVKSIKFKCTVKGDSEAMFRPAVYRIENYAPSNASSRLPENMVPKLVVSMIGCYRNVARQGDKIQVSGMLEHVVNLDTDNTYYQVVVGTGRNEEENICPL